MLIRVSGWTLIHVSESFFHQGGVQLHSFPLFTNIYLIWMFKSVGVCALEEERGRSHPSYLVSEQVFIAAIRYTSIIGDSPSDHQRAPSLTCLLLLSVISSCVCAHTCVVSVWLVSLSVICLCFLLRTLMLLLCVRSDCTWENLCLNPPHVLRQKCNSDGTGHSDSFHRRSTTLNGTIMNKTWLIIVIN